MKGELNAFNKTKIRNGHFTEFIKKMRKARRDDLQGKGKYWKTLNCLFSLLGL